MRNYLPGLRRDWERTFDVMMPSLNGFNFGVAGISITTWLGGHFCTNLFKELVMAAASAGAFYSVQFIFLSQAPNLIGWQ